MLSSRDDDLLAYASGFRASFGSIRLTALTSALSRLLSASDAVATAVQGHDHVGLLEANARSDALIGEINGLTAELTEDEREQLDEVGVTELCAQLASRARRNAFLIEQAWAVDAALTRLLASLGRINPDGFNAGYAAAPSPTYVDRQA